MVNVTIYIPYMDPTGYDLMVINSVIHFFRGDLTTIYRDLIVDGIKNGDLLVISW